MNVFLHEAWGWHWAPGTTPAPPADDAPARSLGQDTTSLVNTRETFFRSVDIKLLIVVDMPDGRLFVSLEPATEPAWSIPSPAALLRWGAVGGEQGTPGS